MNFDKLDSIDEQIARYRRGIAVLVEAKAYEKTEIVVTFRELATIRAALYCWKQSFEQANDEQDWPEIDIASGADRQFKPLGEDEIELLRLRLT